MPRTTSAAAAPGTAAAETAVLMTDDPELVAQVQRLAAAGGTALRLVSGPAETLPFWGTAPMVLVGADVVAALADLQPARRDRVHVLGRGPLPDGLFRSALAAGAESVVELPDAEAWLVEAFLDATEGSVGNAPVIGVIGGCGGAGATTFAAALAMGAAIDVPAVTLVDADPLGAGMERVVGLDEAGAGWTQLSESAGRLGARSLRAALPRRDGLAVLGWGYGRRFDLGPHVAREAVSAAQKGCSLVVVDLPRRAEPATAEILTRCDEVVVVTTLNVSAVAAAARVAALVAPLVPRTGLVTRGRPTALQPETVAEALGLPLVTSMTDQRRVDESMALGLGPAPTRRGPLARAARTTLALVMGPGDGR